jgi:hypothetical protein
VSKGSKNSPPPWHVHQFENMRHDLAYINTMGELAYALSHENVGWLLSGPAGWGVVLNTPIECRQSTQGKTKGTIIKDDDLSNRAVKARWQADPAVYRHIQAKAYVEHPYEKQPTKDFIVAGVLAARKRGLNSQIIESQVADIIDARLDCVLVPASEDPKSSQPHDDIKDLIGTKKDGMVQKYSMIPLVDHDTQVPLTLADLQNADDDMKRRVEVAMVTLTGTPWVFPPASVPAPRKLKAPVPKTNNKVTKPRAKLPQVSEAHLRAAMIKMGIDPAAPSNQDADPDNGYSFKRVGGVRVILSGVKFTGGGGFSTGRFEALPGKPTFRSLTLKEFDDHVATIVKGIQRGVY